MQPTANRGKKVMCIQRTIPAIVLLAAAFSTAASANSAPTDATTVFSSWSFLTQRETWVAVSVLVFGMFMAGFTIVLLRSSKINGDDALRIVALLTIVSGTLFLVGAGYDAEQISPALGLLGTVAGYLLGRSEGSKSGEKNVETPK